MGYITSLILLLFFIILRKKEKTLASPSVLFCLLWTLVSFLAAIRLFNLNEVKETTWLIVLIGAVSFIMGSQIVVTLGKKKNGYSSNYQLNLYGNYLAPKLYWILFIAVGVLAVFDLIDTFELMRKGYSLGLIRQASFGIIELAGYTPQLSYIHSLLRAIREALQAILIATAIDYFWADIKHNKKFIISAIFLVAVDAFSSGGRWGIAYFGAEFFVCYMIRGRKLMAESGFSISRKTKKRIYAFGLLLVI